MMKTKFKLALWVVLLFFSFSNASEKNNGQFIKGEELVKTKTLKNWIARHAMSSKKYQDNFTKFNNKGYRLTSVDGYLVNGKLKYAALWQKGNTSGLIARHGLTGKQYQDEVNKWSGKGYRLIHVDGSSDGSKARYAAIWKKGNQAGLRARHGLTSSQYQNEFTKNHKAGYRLVHVSGYGVKGKLYYAAIWKKGKNDNYVAKHGLSSKQYQDVYTKFAKKGYKLTHIDGYDAKGKVYYACIMEKASGIYSARHGMNGINYQLEYDNHYYQGFVPVSVSGHDGGKGAGYAASFKSVGGWNYAQVKQLDDKIKAVQKKFKIPGVSIAIVKDGKLVYAKGYGYGEKDKKEIASATSIYRLASISKSITSVAIMKLVEQRKLKLTDKVFGKGKILGTTYGTKAYSNREKTITVEHLLEHTAAWAGGMKITTKESYKDLFKRILDGKDLTHTPGTNYKYSNFGFCVLGRVIAKKSGLSYEDYVKKYVLKPSGISRMQIGANDKKDRVYKEVAYYRHTYNPYDLKMSKMDAHGGWIASPIDLMRFIVRVDGQPSKKDIIKASSFNAMTTSSSPNKGYAKGWNVNGSASRMSHSGGMAGTSTVLKKMNNNFSFAILSNSTGNGEGQGNALKTAIQEGINAISSWPDLDLF